MSKPTRSSQQVEQLRATVNQLQELLVRMHAERERAAKRRRKRLLMIAVPISLALHVLIMLYLALMYRGGEGDGGAGPMFIEFAMVHNEQLESLEDTDLSDLLDEPVDLSLQSVDTPAVPLDAVTPNVELAQPNLAGIESLGGSGDGLGGEGGLSAGGGGTSYFGIAGRGTRFAYIVDRSGSMGYLNRMAIANAELAKSIQSLPDYAHFYLLYFSSDVLEPPMQRGWLQARRQNVTSIVRWINAIDPGGGTLPRTSFQNVFALDVLPDVIFFMTDGIIAPSALTAEEVARMNNRSKKVVIHTIAFGDQGSEDLLRRISRESGGTYRYVPDGDSTR